MKDLTLALDGVLLEQSTILSSAISSPHLDTVDITKCRFENDGSFEQTLRGCAKVDCLRVGCKHNLKCNALAAFLRDQTNEIRQLEIKFNSDLDGEQCARDISASLVVNKHLRSLELGDHDGLCELDWFDSNKLLCDVSSIKSIINSNHTLLWLEVSGHTPSTLAEQCLDLNHCSNEAWVIRSKILQFFFFGEFDVDVSSSSNMAVSVIPVDIRVSSGKQ